MPTARTHLAAKRGPDNLIYAIGGVGGPNVVDAYNPTTSKWTTVAPMPTARHGLAAATGPDDRIATDAGGAQRVISQNGGGVEKIALGLALVQRQAVHLPAQASPTQNTRRRRNLPDVANR
jgi:hypothetical protein